MLYRIVNGSITLGGHTILEEIHFQVNKGDKIGIVGRNGSGKSTFLKGIVHEVEIEEGISEDSFRVDKIGDYRIGYVKKNVSFDKEVLMIDYLLEAYEEIILVERKLEWLNQKICDRYEGKVVEEYNKLLDRYRNIGGYEYKKEYSQAAKMFGFGEGDFLKKMGDFSSGQITKIAFIRLLLSKPDLLLLDEPTNHLDLEMIEWLEGYLHRYDKSMIVVSHDRMFLDTVCNVIYEIEFGAMTRYSGNYSFYVQKKEEDYCKLVRDYERQQMEIDRLEEIADRFRYKPSKASMAMSKLKQIERMVKIDKPRKGSQRSFVSWLAVEYESYRNVLKVKDLLVGYNRVLSKVNFSIERGDKLGIIGRNGVGKSTFLKILMGEICPLGGKYVFGNKVKIGYFDQNLDSLNEENTVYEEIEREFPGKSSYEIRKMLGAFDFREDNVNVLVNELSGGEKVRLSLCKIFGNRPNVIILDEPTNHLDIINKETIQNMLMSYKGTVLMVSHDRYLLNQVCNKILVMNGEESCFYNFGFEEYMELAKNEKEKILKDVVDEKFEVGTKKKQSSCFKERSKLERRMKKLEEEIFILEKKRDELNHCLLEEDVYSNLVKAREIAERIREMDMEIENKMQSWEEIGEIIF